MSDIHPTAIIEDGAIIADGVSIGPYCVVGPEVELAEEVKLNPHVVISGSTNIGARTEIFQFASVGSVPQDLKYSGEKVRLEIGSDTVIRECATINPGTAGGGGVTRVGDKCLIMAYSHIGHDCFVGNHTILVNNATLAGHVVLGDHAVIGGLSAVHQFVRIGPHAMVGGMTGVEADIIPYGSVIGNRAYLAGLNLVGLKRRGFSRDIIHELRQAYRMLFADEGTMAERIEDVATQFSESTEIMEIVEFMRAPSDRGLCKPS